MLPKFIRVAVKRTQLAAEPISAVHDDDLEEFLASIGALGDIKAGVAHCKFCSDPMTLHGLQYVFPDSGAVAFVCNKEPCIRRFLTYYGERHE